MSNFGLPQFSNPLDNFKSAGVTNDTTRDASPPRNLVKMSIEPVGEPFNANQTFLLNPISIAESKSANWVKHHIPGQSDPILQWINGTEKTISMTAMVTKDIANNPSLTYTKNADIWTAIINPELNEKYATALVFDGDILKTNQSLAPDNGVVVNPDDTRRYWSRSISTQLEFYRSLVIPRTGSSANLTKTPPLVYLRAGTLLGTSVESFDMKFILATYSMNITEFSPELEPTKATVSFTFVEYVDRSKTFTPLEEVKRGPPPKPIIDNTVGSSRGITERTA